MSNDQLNVDVAAVDSRFRRQAMLALAGAALFALLGFGAVTTTFAADPSPSPSAGTEATPAPDSDATPAPGQTDRGQGNHRGTRGDCPDKDGQGGGSDEGDGSDNGDDASPAPSDSADASASSEA
jgi:hypothetical protein